MVRPALVVFLALSLNSTARADDLVVLFTSDMHSQLAPRTVQGVGERGGVARLRTLLHRERAFAPGRTLLVDAGDFAMGTPFHTRFRERAYELTHLARLGYDAVTFGNHDFDFGPDGLAAALEAARREGALPKLVAANLDVPVGDPRAAGLAAALARAEVTPYHVLERAGFRIGLFGLMGHDAAGDAAAAVPVRFTDAARAARAVVRTLRERERVDLVIALSHGGTAAPPARSEDEELARDVPGIDLIVSGHSHRPIREPLRIGATTIVRAGALLQNLGRVTFARGGAGFLLRDHALLPLDDSVPEDAEVKARVEEAQRDVEAHYFAQFGMGSSEVLTHVPFATEQLDALPAHPGELSLGNLVTDAYAAAIRNVTPEGEQAVDVVLHPLGHLRDALPAGPVRVADAFSVLSLGLGLDDVPGYPLVSFFVRGHELRDMLEVEATLAPKKRTAHLQVSGARFRYNPHRLPGDRVHRVWVGGRPLDPARPYRVAMNLYVASRIGFMAEASRGLLSATPRDAALRPLRDLRLSRVDRDLATPGVQELKEWVALAQYLRRAPTLSRRYARPEGRFGPLPSWAPLALLGSPHGLTRVALFVLALLVGLTAWLAFRRVRRRALLSRGR